MNNITDYTAIALNVGSFQPCQLSELYELDAILKAVRASLSLGKKHTAVLCVDLAFRAASEPLKETLLSTAEALIKQR